MFSLFRKTTRAVRLRAGSPDSSSAPIRPPSAEPLYPGDLEVLTRAGVDDPPIFPYVPGSPAIGYGDDGASSGEYQSTSGSPALGFDWFSAYPGRMPPATSSGRVIAANEEQPGPVLLDADTSFESPHDLGGEARPMSAPNGRDYISWVETGMLELPRVSVFNRHSVYSPPASTATTSSQLVSAGADLSHEDSERCSRRAVSMRRAYKYSNHPEDRSECPTDEYHSDSVATEDQSERAILRWEPVDGMNERLVVEIQGPESMRVIPVEFPLRQRCSASTSRVQQLQHLVTKPIPATAHLNSASLSGSNVPHDQLYEQELDWVASHQGEETLPARLLGILRGKSNHGSEPLVARPTTWDVVQHNSIPVDANLSSLDWLSGGILGEGSYSKVYLVYHKPAGKEVAMKVTYMKRPLPAVVCQGIANELRVMEMLSQQEQSLPFILRPVAIGQRWAWTSTEGFLHLLTEFCPGGDLFGYKGSLSEDCLRYVLAELVLAIESLHSLGIVHHDIKPENILVDADGHCVLTDFGGSKFLSETRKIQPHASGHVVATLPYAAPEILEDTVTEEYDESIDWWSLGSTILTLLTGEEYFSMDSRGRLKDIIPHHVKNIRYTMELYDQCPPELIDLVESLLEVDPKLRLRGPAIKYHAYFSHLPYSWDIISRRIPGIIPPIPVVHSVAAHCQGTKATCKDWPSVFDSNDPNQCYLVAELRKEGLVLPIDNSCDVLVMHHQTLKN